MHPWLLMFFLASAGTLGAATQNKDKSCLEFVSRNCENDDEEGWKLITNFLDSHWYLKKLLHLLLGYIRSKNFKNFNPAHFFCINSLDLKMVLKFDQANPCSTLQSGNENFIQSLNSLVTKYIVDSYKFLYIVWVYLFILFVL